MSDNSAKRDPNRVTSLIGVDSITFEDTTTAAVDPTTHELLVKASGSVVVPLITNFALETGGNLALIKAKTDNLDVALSTRLSESDFDTKTGSLIETAPATDTASSGLNGRLQRIAQRISSLITAIGSPFQAGGAISNTSFGITNWIGSTAPTVGQKSMANSVPVVISSDQSSIPMTNTNLDVALSTRASDASVAAISTEIARPATATLTNVSGSASSVTLLSLNANRKGFMIYNDSNADLYVKFGTTASVTSFTVKLGKDEFYEMNERVYTGRIDGIWSSATGAARITELTP